MSAQQLFVSPRRDLLIAATNTYSISESKIRGNYTYDIAFNQYPGGYNPGFVEAVINGNPDTTYQIWPNTSFAPFPQIEIRFEHVSGAVPTRGTLNQWLALTTPRSFGIVRNGPGTVSAVIRARFRADDTKEELKVVEYGFVFSVSTLRATHGT